MEIRYNLYSWKILQKREAIETPEHMVSVFLYL